MRFIFHVFQKKKKDKSLKGGKVVVKDFLN